jgi:thymidine kinase
MNRTETAYLEIILGPMFSGKTSKLLQIHKQCIICNIPVLTINHKNDNERNVEKSDYLKSHDNLQIPCVSTDTLSKVYTNAYQVILINEGQFFHDILPFVKTQLALKKQIYIAGLDGDFQCNIFGDLLSLIPLCDKVEKLSSLCGICKNGNPGIFSKRISRETDQTVIGGSDKYIPVCRICHEKDIEDKVV